MTIDLATLSSKELDTLITKAKKRKVALKKRKPAAAVRRTDSALSALEFPADPVAAFCTICTVKFSGPSIIPSSG